MPGKFTVAICGGGVGGLTTAVALSQYPDIDVDMYEAANAFGEIGAGIGVWPRTWKALDKLGLGEDLTRVTHLLPSADVVDTFNFRKSDQPDAGIDFYTMKTNGGFLTYHRPDFQQVLIDHLPPSYSIHFSKRLESYTTSPSGKIYLVFSDGTTSSCDILVGADGIKSAVRRTMLQLKAEEAQQAGKTRYSERLLQSIDPRWVGVLVYRAVIPVDRLEEYALVNKAVRVPQIPTVYMGQHAKVVVYPISGGRAVNIGSFQGIEELHSTTFAGDWITKATNEELMQQHIGWEPELLALLACAENVTRMSVHAAVPLTSWVSGNVALLGDAAHAMSPQQGSGAGQAIEDAYILGTLLGHPLARKDNIARVLSIYDAVRCPAATQVAEKSLKNGRYFGLQFPGSDLEKDTDRLHELGAAIEENWSWAWTTALDGAAEEAARRLQMLLD